MSCSQGSGLSSTLSSLGENSLSEGEPAVLSVPAIDYSPERSTIGIPGAGLVTSSLSYYLGYAEDPYGPLRPLFQKALIEGSSPENDLYSYYRAADIFPGLSALMGEE